MKYNIAVLPYWVVPHIQDTGYEVRTTRQSSPFIYPFVRMIEKGHTI